MMDRRSWATMMAIVTVLLLIALKLTVGMVTRSIGMISQAIDSITDLMASILAFYAVRMSTRPADDLHPYGHSKIENLASVIVGSIMFFAALLVGEEAVRRLAYGEAPVMLELGIGVMAIAAAVNLVVSSYLFRVARLERSMALEADATHLRVDVMSNLGVMGGLIVIRLTGITLLDPIIALVMVAYVMLTAIRLIIRASADLLDENILPEEEKVVREVLAEHSERYHSFHALRARRGGDKSYLELHIVVEGEMRVDEAHDLIEHLEDEMMARLPHLRVTVHMEPER